jgi:hypothetical protein
MGKLRYTGDTEKINPVATVKELRAYAKLIGVKNTSKLKTRFQLIQAIENLIGS